jgi:hypothetical protein
VCGLNDFRDPQQLLRSFRRHPVDVGDWLFKEEWWFGGVWQISGRTELPGHADFFAQRPLTIMDSVGESGWLGPPFLLYFALRRRAWLKRHGKRVPRAVWKKASPLG